MIAAVKAQLLAKNLTQAKLAEITGITTRTISNFLTGKRLPHDLTLATISSALDWPPQTLKEILTGGAPPPPGKAIDGTPTSPDPRISEATIAQLATELQRRLNGRGELPELD